MRILIVCKAFHPDRSPRASRATELAKEFVRQGHEVTVLSHGRDYDYRGFLQEYPIRMESHGKLRWPSLREMKGLGDLPRKLERLLYMLFDYPHLEIAGKVAKALRNKQGYDLLISIAVPYPVHWGVARARSANHPIAQVWAADCGDPFMGNTLESFRYPFYMGHVERWFMRKADYVVIPTEGARQAYFPEFHGKIRVIPQGFEMDGAPVHDFPPTNPRPTFAYAGGVSKAGVRSPVKLLEFLASSGADFSSHWYLTSGAEAVQPFATQMPDRVNIHQPLPRRDLLAELSQMDFLLNFDNGTEHQKPSKLIDYGLTGRPILNIDASRPDTALVQDFLSGDHSGSLDMGDLRSYDIRNVAAAFLALVPR